MIITLLSDLGHNDPYVAYAKSIILKHFPNTHIIDIAHDVLPLNTIQSSYFWNCIAFSFPDRTFHISLTDLLMSLPNNILVDEQKNHFFLSSDNGLLTSISEKTKFKIGKKVAATFADYVNICCEYIAQIVKENFSVASFIDFDAKKIINFPDVEINDHSINVIVIHIDSYENIITNLTKDRFEVLKKDRNYKLNFLRTEEINHISNSYATNDLKQEIIAYFNEFGYLQISLKDKNNKSASLLGFKIFKKESQINNYLTIHFE